MRRSPLGFPGLSTRPSKRSRLWLVPQAAANGSASATDVVWYSDPIVFALVVLALFAAVDIAILIAKHSHHGNRHVLR